MTVSTLFGTVAVQDIDLEAWQRAWNAWLNRKSRNTRRAYALAWKDLRMCTGREPWQVTSSDLELWLADMGRRNLAATTVGQRLAAVRSFYGYVSKRYMVAGLRGGENPLHHYNPGQSVEAPRIDKYEGAVYLSAEQVRALIMVIPRNEVCGLRNYALLLFYIATGRRSAEVRNLRWGDFRKNGERVMYHWQGKGKQRWDECPVEIWVAILEYLAAAGLLDGMNADDYIFTAIGDHARRLPGTGADYTPRKTALSGTEVVRILRRYAKAAGIDADGLRVHSLRHTSAMLMRTIGMDTKEIQEQLGHSSLKTTDGYLHALAGGKNVGWEKVRNYLGLL